MAVAFITLGALFIAGLAADTIGRRTRLPRVTLLLLLGVLAGPSVTGLVPPTVFDWYEPISVIALTMVAFLLGGSLTRQSLSRSGRAILSVSLSIVVLTILVVALGLWMAGLPVELALVLGAIATATDPAATRETLNQAGHDGPLADTILGVVAIDDAWGMIAFSLAVVGAQALAGGAVEGGHLLEAFREIGGAIVLGVGLGIPAAFLTGRVRSGEPTRFEALGLVFLAAGIALWAEVSFLLAAMTLGAVIANLAKHHDRAFHEIEWIEPPFLILFFILAGAAFDLGALALLGLAGAVFVILRIIARVAGGWIGGRLAGLPPAQSRWIGSGLLAQAGVAVGMALVAAEAMPQHAETILMLTIGTTVLFELIGPPVLLVAMRRSQA